MQILSAYHRHHRHHRGRRWRYQRNHCQRRRARLGTASGCMRRLHHREPPVRRRWRGRRKKEGRPPWCNYTGGAATARCASSYGDGGGARQASSYEPGGGIRPKSAMAKRRQQQAGGSVTPSQLRAKKHLMAQERRRNASAASTPTPLPSSKESQHAASDQRHAGSRQRLQQQQKEAADYLHLPFPKTFHVDVRRPNPNRPWRLTAAPSPSLNPPRRSSSNPVVMFPNPAFVQHSLPTAKPSPFRSFQLKPLNLSSEIHPSPAATVRSYLSPSKQSPRQSLENPPTLPSTNIDDLCSDRNCEPLDNTTLKHKEKGWLSRRLSLPSSSATRRFSLLLPRRDEGSPAKPLPSLITRLPTRHLSKPASVHSLLSHSPVSRLSRQKHLQTSNGAKGNGTSGSGNNVNEPLSPLPLPPALRGAPTPAPSHKRSNSCPRQHFRTLDSNSSGHQEEIVEEERAMPKRQGEAVGKENFNQGGRKKLDCRAFADCGAPSVWPTLKRTWSFTHHNDTTSKCTGAGPFLLKHMKAWVHNNKRAGFDAPKPMELRRTS